MKFPGQFSDWNFWFDRVPADLHGKVLFQRTHWWILDPTLDYFSGSRCSYMSRSRWISGRNSWIPDRTCEKRFFGWIPSFKTTPLRNKLVLGEMPGQVLDESPVNPVLNGFQVGSPTVCHPHILLRLSCKSVSF